MDSALLIAEKLGQLGSLLVLGYLGFFHLVEKGYLKIGKNGIGDGKEPKKDINTPQWVVDFVNNYNHKQTDLLTDIRDGIKEINSKHEEWDKYGIKTRDCE